jgi:uncharacterized membrane protein HdeD (DUF308 family)
MITASIAATIRHHWWLFLLRGLLSLAFGILVLAWPGAAVVALMAFVAAYALVDGIVSLLMAFRLRATFPRWWMVLLHGVIAVAFGVAAFMYPKLSLFYIVLSVAFWMLIASLAQFALAGVQKALGASWAWAALGGILTLVLAVAAVAYPWVTATGVVFLMAWFALVIGLVMVVVAVRIRRLAKVVA